jgi:phosphatidate cytidylyltransferase
MTAATTTRRWSDLRKRFLSAAILAPAALACIWLGAEPFTAMVAIAVAILTWEWVHLCGLRTRTAPGFAVPVVVLGAGALAVLDRPLAALLLLLLGFVVTYAFAKLLRRRRDPDRPQMRSMPLALGVLYIGLAGISLIMLRHDNGAGQANVLFLVLIVWGSDIGAYMAGRLVGGPKLWPAVSPNKTWSGALGGVATVVLVGMLASTLLVPGSLLAAALVAVVLGVATQAGDLLESAIKRQFKVKDTSSLIPGHGGLLDRLDGLLAAAPVAALIALCRGYGVPLWW